MMWFYIAMLVDITSIVNFEYSICAITDQVNNMFAEEIMKQFNNKEYAVNNRKINANHSHRSLELLLANTGNPNQTHIWLETGMCLVFVVKEIAL
jgi:hypothetical protein